MLKLLENAGKNPLVVLGFAVPVLVDYCDKHGISRNLLCDMIAEHDRKPIEAEIVEDEK